MIGFGTSLRSTGCQPVVRGPPVAVSCCALAQTAFGRLPNATGQGLCSPDSKRSACPTTGERYGEGACKQPCNPFRNPPLSFPELKNCAAARFARFSIWEKLFCLSRPIGS